MTGPDFAQCFMLDQSPSWDSMEKYMTTTVIPASEFSLEQVKNQKCCHAYFSDFFKLNDITSKSPRKFNHHSSDFES